MQQLLDLATAFTALVVVDGPGCFVNSGAGDPWLWCTALVTTRTLRKLPHVNATCPSSYVPKYYLRNQVKHYTQFTLTNKLTFTRLYHFKNPRNKQTNLTLYN